MDAPQELERTPLYETHVSLKARMASFAGWEMPVQYAGILDESRAVRSKAGLFDVSHMGRVEIQGPGAASFLDRLLSVNVPGIRIGRARYNVICDQEGGIIDDCIVYRRGQERFLLIPNAANTSTVLEWLGQWARRGDQVQMDDVTARYAMIALQGPQATVMLEGLSPANIASIRPFAAVETQVSGTDAFLARTGYSGEDGFELIVLHESAAHIWRLLMEMGAIPCALGARDVLRLEAGLLLHGADMDASTNPYEAGLDRFVNPDRDGYVAGEVLRAIRDKGPARRLVGFSILERRIARHGYPIVDGSRELGRVTSGGYSPTLDRNIGLGYVPTVYSPVGSRFQVDIRGRYVGAEVTALPFYSRRRSA